MKNKLTATLPLALLAIGMLGSVTSVNADDLNNSIFVPVNPPCRVGDTRGTSTPSIPADGHVEWFAYGTDMSDQGGNAAGCPQPKAGMTPTGISVNIAVYGPQAEGRGNLVAYPADASAPTAAILNYYPVPTDLFPSPSISNSTIVSLCQEGACDGKFKIQANNAAVPVIADVQGYFYARPSGVAQVAVRGGDYSSPVDAMNDLDKWCGTPSATNQCLMKIAPGNYDVGATPVVMQEWVSIQGSGKLTTIISGTIGDAIVTGANNVSLTDLSIINSGDSGAASAGIQNTNASPSIQRVDVHVSGGSDSNRGIFSVSSSLLIQDVAITVDGGGVGGATGILSARLSSVVMRDVTVVAEGGTGTVGNSGIVSLDVDSVSMRDIDVTVTGGDLAQGVVFDGCDHAVMDDVTIIVSDGSVENNAVFANSTKLFMTNGFATAHGTGYGLKITNIIILGSSETYVRGGYLEGKDGAKALFINRHSPLTRIAHSAILGGVDNQLPKSVKLKEICRGNYDQNLADVDCK